MEFLKLAGKYVTEIRLQVSKHAIKSHIPRFHLQLFIWNDLQSTIVNKINGLTSTLRSFIAAILIHELARHLTKVKNSKSHWSFLD